MSISKCLSNTHWFVIVSLGIAVNAKVGLTVSCFRNSTNKWWQISFSIVWVMLLHLYS